jgi:SNF2 family DNA or RNA helicase
MLVLHGNWVDASFHLWGESLTRYVQRTGSLPSSLTASGASASATATSTAMTSSIEHPYALTIEELVDAVSVNAMSDSSPWTSNGSPLRLRLPSDLSGPLPSDRLNALIGQELDDTIPALRTVAVPALRIDPAFAIDILLFLESQDGRENVQHGHALRYWILVARFVLELLVDQRFIPTVVRHRDDQLHATWQPWLHDPSTRERIAALLEGMPPVVRATVNGHDTHPWTILDEALTTITDATVRRALIADNYIDSLDGRDPAADAHVTWLSGLLDQPAALTAEEKQTTELMRDAARWVGRLDDTGQAQRWRLVLRLDEPEQSEQLKDLSPLDASVTWRLSFHLASADDPDIEIEAEQLWTAGTGRQQVGADGQDQPQEVFLKELARAARIYQQLESSLEASAPTGIDLTTAHAYTFLREYMPVLEESGIIVGAPTWWNEPSARLGARMVVDSPELDGAAGTPDHGATRAMLGLNSLVQYQWQISIGDQALTMEEFDALAKQRTGLVRIRGQWVEIEPQQLAAARSFLDEHSGGEISLLQAMQLANGVDGKAFGLPVFGMEATGWVGEMLEATSPNHSLTMVEQPQSFLGDLRPYQRVGLSWLVYLDRLGLGACLADDMGLGKTIQLIALLLHEREMAGQLGGTVGPTLLVVPTSLIGNWQAELKRFAPNLSVHIHHGPDRPTGDLFVSRAERSDVVITTYALVARDVDSLKRVNWHRVTLDEAQYIKNPPTKQTTAIRSLNSRRRITLTGTPVENRLSELWSIMEFCNPGYLGTSGNFRRRFAVPIERHRDRQQSEHLRRLVQPFVLRRAKTDPKVIDDLPPCVTTKEYATLTQEQVRLYEDSVQNMLGTVDKAEGIQRRGLVLATLVKLKQICNHPALLEADASELASVGAGNGDRSVVKALSRRSGKAARIITMLEEIHAAGEKALIFTQFRKMGHLLTAMIEHDLDLQTSFLHGGTPQRKRQDMIDHFQSDDGPPVFILSLKAGGVGLNLTAANHVFHYDRWWNPAVENQATDRAFRIGQKRTVHVHKFVCMGTLEERIDQMLEEKVELAQSIIGSGEDWLTDLSTQQLRELLTLRSDAVEGDE